MLLLSSLLHRIYQSIPELQVAFQALHQKSIALELTKPQKKLRLTVFPSALALEEQDFLGNEVLHLREIFPNFYE